MQVSLGLLMIAFAAFENASPGLTAESHRVHKESKNGRFDRSEKVAKKVRGVRIRRKEGGTNLMAAKSASTHRLATKPPETMSSEVGEGRDAAGHAINGGVIPHTSCSARARLSLATKAKPQCGPPKKLRMAQP